MFSWKSTNTIRVRTTQPLSARWHLWRTKNTEKSLMSTFTGKFAGALWRGDCFGLGVSGVWGGKWLFFCSAARFLRVLCVMWSWREMSQGLWVRTELLCLWSFTEKQWASCEPAHPVLSQALCVALAPSSGGATSARVWIIVPELSASSAKVGYNNVQAGFGKGGQQGYGTECVRDDLMQRAARFYPGQCDAGWSILVTTLWAAVRDVRW